MLFRVVSFYFISFYFILFQFNSCYFTLFPFISCHFISLYCVILLAPLPTTHMIYYITTHLWISDEIRFTLSTCEHPMGFDSPSQTVNIRWDSIHPLKLWQPDVAWACLGDMKELNTKSIKALEDMSKKRQWFRKRSTSSSAYTQIWGKCFIKLNCPWLTAMSPISTLLRNIPVDAIADLARACQHSTTPHPTPLHSAYLPASQTHDQCSAVLENCVRSLPPIWLSLSQHNDWSPINSAWSI